MRARAISIAKPNQGTINEDAAKATEDFIAVSDGAGGGGIYADKWSAHLVDKLPTQPILTFAGLDAWVKSIWEPFYNECEAMAKAAGGMVLNKFYDEGSFATLAAIWYSSESCHWMAYGDSVAFCYNPDDDILQHSFGHLRDFGNPPYLINCKDELSENGFKSGTFETSKNSIIFCTSDALAHYILMMYELSHCSAFADELQEAERTGTRESSFIKNASSAKFDFCKDVLLELMNCENPDTFEKHISKLLKNKLIALDDYSFTFKTL
ncbi:hypothetical protein [Leyella stercorea]